MKAVKIVEITEERTRVVNHVFVREGKVENQMLHLTAANDIINKVIAEGAFNPSPKVSKFVSAKTEPELLVDSLRFSLNNRNYEVYTSNEEESLAVWAA